ncbi:MAG: penicillin-binding protein activator [Chitinispirillaceae bacterium]|nr:penicillin-binding protein activator [Chitinispirillaceae bacterium]
MKRVYLIIAALCLGIPCLALEPAGLYSDAVRLYSAGDYDSTILIIRNHLKQHGKDPEAEYLVPLVMEAFVRRNDFNSVNRLFDLYQQKFRKSTFMPRVHYLHGYAQIRERSFLDGFKSFSRALDGGVSHDLDSLIMTAAETVCANALDADKLHDAATERNIDPRIREIARNHEAAATAPPALKAGLTIGLLAPLTGDDADIGRRIVQGIRLAIDKYNSGRGPDINIVTGDTRGSLIETARKTDQLVKQERVPIIIGPMLSPTATVAAAMLAERETVMLSPTATDDGIASLGPNIFQMNITIGVIARAAARYALDNLNIREFAVVAPRGASGAAMAAAFADEVRRSGGTVFADLSFDEGGNDFTAQFLSLRNQLLIRRINQQEKKNVTKISLADSTRWADSSVSIGAIFMPAEAEDAIMLAPQVYFNRIKAQLIGSTGWHTAKTVAEGKHYVQNAIIATVFEPDSTWKKWPLFRREYLAKYREEPDRVAALGYDAASLAIASAAGKRAGIAEALSNVANYEGTSGMISFDRNSRVNSSAVLYRITANGFVRVK